jgi:hypothetical protein
MAGPGNGERSDVWTVDLRSRFDELLDEYRASLHDSLDGLTEEEARLRLVPRHGTEHGQRYLPARRGRPSSTRLRQPSVPAFEDAGAARYLCGLVGQGPLGVVLRTAGVGQGGAPAAKRGPVTLTNPRAGADSVWAGGRRRGGARRYLGARRTSCRRRQQSGFGCPPLGARSRQCYKAVQPEGWRACAWQELTAVENSDVELSDPGRRRRR